MNKTKTIIISIASVLVLALGIFAYYYFSNDKTEGESTLISYPSDSKVLTFTDSQSDNCGCSSPFSSTECRSIGVGQTTLSKPTVCSNYGYPALSWSSGNVGLDSGREIQTIYIDWSATAGTLSYSSCSGIGRVSSSSISVACVINGQEIQVGSTNGIYTAPAGCYFVKATASATGTIAKYCNGGSASTISMTGKITLVPKSYSAKLKTEDIKGATSIGCQ